MTKKKNIGKKAIGKYNQSYDDLTEEQKEIVNREVEDEDDAFDVEDETEVWN
jgi:hypothetical protein